MLHRLLISVLCVAFLTVVPSATAAQTHASRVWIDVSVGAAMSAQKKLTTTVSYPDGDGEFEDYTTTYNSPTGASVDLGGGVMFTRLLGAGIALGGTAHRGAADLSIRIPHPLFFNRHASDSDTTADELQKAEGAFHLQLVVRPVHTEKASIRFFGGPSYFRLTADAVSDIRYSQVFLGQSNTVDITEYDSVEVEATAWGFHAGVDASYFLTKAFGLGAAVKFSRGTVEVDDSRVYTVSGPVDVKVGGFQIVGGLRLRF